MHYLWIFLGGGLGSILRVALASWVNQLAKQDWPWGTLSVNAIGSFAIGWLLARSLTSSGEALALQSFLVLGFCGGFTTFSTFSAETLLLMRDGDWLKASANGVVSVLICLAAVALGHWFGNQQPA